ncbi:hypothetical protein [Pectobacterium brasiliense]|uniref:hypothetical protein n=1 Tax=Pectobacterium brasiliense TaxID=180957 RepID=UPI00196928C6|nr:hypothetical protein [Pectobacterium brasiliense]MBN3261813.1 hypothetical protein [Pectobacterium brasiliense]
MKNKILRKAVDALIKDDNNTLIEKNKIDDIFIINQNKPDYFKFQPLNYIKKTEEIIIEKEREEDEVKIEKIDYTCLEERETMTLGKIFRKIGNTLSHPVSEFTQETQVIHHYMMFGRCAPKEDVESLKETTILLDEIISAIVSLIPQANHVSLLQNIGGPLFRVLGDAADGEKINTDDDLKELILQPAMIARLIVDSSPKDSNGIVIKNKVSLPENFIIRNNKNHIKMGSREWEIQYKEGKYTIKKNNIEREVFYSPEKKNGNTQ